MRKPDSLLSDSRPPDTVDYGLATTWNSQWLMNALRDAIRPLVERERLASDVPFDAQDLEHQSLFFLGTYAPGEITQERIARTVTEQAESVKRRMRVIGALHDLDYLFRGYGSTEEDLNVISRLTLKSRDGALVAAAADGRVKDVECRLVDDPEIVSLFTQGFHYIHQERAEGDAFGLYFKGDRYPWAVETAESSLLSRDYKRYSLAMAGFDPDKGVELTRLYTLPGSPRNAISTLDGITAKHYRAKGMESMFTRTMPSYSKTKSSTVAGGMDQVLCIKELRQHFIREEEEWVSATRRRIEFGRMDEIRSTHHAFGLLPAVDVYMDLRPPEKRAPSVVPAGKALFFSDSPLIIPHREAYAHHPHRYGQSVQTAKAFGYRPAVPATGLVSAAA